jgi:hypothetical protein
MLRYLQPGAMYASVWEVDIDRLLAMGIKGLLVDLDNTLVEYHRYEASPRLERWLASVRSCGLQVCIVSNSRRRTAAERLAQELGVPVIVRAAKPRRGGLRRAVALLGTEVASTAVIGDQLFTDVLGGNRLGCFTVLVRPLGRREFVGTRITRLVETFAFWLMGRCRSAKGKDGDAI